MAKVCADSDLVITTAKLFGRKAPIIITAEMVADLKGTTYCLCVDVNGYAGTHNSRFSQPLSGDYGTDLINSRDKRIFDDPTGKRSARNTNPFLLQTYARDTGEVMSDLALPIFVKERHWGAVRLGFDPVILLAQDKIG